MFFKWENPCKWRGRWLWAEWFDGTATNLLEMLLIRPIMYLLVPMTIVAVMFLLPIHVLTCIKLGKRPDGGA